VAQDTIDSILSCYRTHCQYVKKAGFYSGDHLPLDPERDALLSMKAELAVPESCYIDDTGHFNAVEFNICYNQMIYLLMAYAVDHGLLDIGISSLEEFKQRMLPDILIIDMKNKFRRAMNSNQLFGTVSIHKCVSRKQMFILKTSCHFFDDEDGEQYGDVTLAILKHDNSSQVAA
jgi:hypothetical protein